MRIIIHRLRGKSKGIFPSFRPFFRFPQRFPAFEFPPDRAIVTVGHLYSLERMDFQRTDKKANAGRFECGYLKT